MTVLLFGFGMEWIVIIGALVLLFGASRLPELAKSIGKTRKAFKEGMREADEEEFEEKKMITQTSNTNTMSDEELMAEMRRRVEQKQS